MGTRRSLDRGNLYDRVLGGLQTDAVGNVGCRGSGAVFDLGINLSRRLTVRGALRRGTDAGVAGCSAELMFNLADTELRICVGIISLNPLNDDLLARA